MLGFKHIKIRHQIMRSCNTYIYNNTQCRNKWVLRHLIMRSFTEILMLCRNKWVPRDLITRTFDTCFIEILGVVHEQMSTTWSNHAFLWYLFLPQYPILCENKGAPHNQIMLSLISFTSLCRENSQILALSYSLVY